MKTKLAYDMDDVLRPIRKERLHDAILKARIGIEYIAYAGVFFGFIAGGAYTIFNLI